MYAEGKAACVAEYGVAAAARDAIAAPWLQPYSLGYTVSCTNIAWRCIALATASLLRGLRYGALEHVVTDPIPRSSQGSLQHPRM